MAGDQSLHVGTFDTVRIPLAGPSSAEPAAGAELQIEESVREDASVVPWQDRSTYNCQAKNMKPRNVKLT